MSVEQEIQIELLEDKIQVLTAELEAYTKIENDLLDILVDIVEEYRGA